MAKKGNSFEKKLTEWENTTLKESLEKFPENIYRAPTEFPKQRLYTPKDLVHFDYLSDLGFPGEYPYTRSIHPTMYRSRLWGMAQYSGYGTSEDTNKRWKLLLSEGQDGVSLAVDVPTHLGYDSDDPRAEPEVGLSGVACPSLKEMEIIFDEIPMDQITIRGSCNQEAIVIWSMYMATAEKRGISSDKLGGNVVADWIVPYIANGDYIFSPKGAMRLGVDLIEYCLKHIPRLSYQILAYSYREAGSTLVQEAAFGLATATTLLEAALQRGLAVDDFAPRLTFNLSVNRDLFEEIAKFRALRRLYATIMKEKYGAKKPSSLWFKFGVSTGGETLAALEPENNITRVTIEALAAILGGAQYIHTSSYDEAICVPSEKAVTLALRTMQILAYECGVIDTVDPLGGSYYIESLTSRIEEEIKDYLKKIEAQGGMMKAIETNWAQREIERGAYKKDKEISEGRQVIVGVNKFGQGRKPADVEICRADPKILQDMRLRLEKLRRERDNTAVQCCLADIRKAAQGTENLVPFVLDAVRNYATVGEICGVLRDVLGTY